MNINNLKRNQVIIFVIALMLVVAGYFSYTTNNKESIYTSASVNEIDRSASIGDAKLVSSNGVIETNTESGLVDNDNMSDNTVDSQFETSNENTIINDSVTTNSKDIDEYFSSSKLSRDAMYSQMIETYQKILENESIPADQKSIAQTEIKNINETKNKIMICENLIKNKEIKDIVIFINNDSVNVIVEADKLEQAQIAQIQNIITREIKVDLNNIHISNR